MAEVVPERQALYARGRDLPCGDLPMRRHWNMTGSGLSGNGARSRSKA